MSDILRLENITKEFTFGRTLSASSGGKRTIRAVDNVSLTLAERSTLGLVGESGSGKTTVGKLISSFYNPDSGKIFFYNKPLKIIPVKRRVKSIQMIFQDPYASMNPKLSIGFQLYEAVKHGNWEIPLGKPEIMEKVKHYIDQVGLTNKVLDAYPHQFSGGELQRITIARALAMQPKLIIADEPVSSLDLSIQAQILNLFKDLKKEFDLSYVFISHDLAVINYMSDYIIVMKEGRIVEQGNSSTILTHPSNPYTIQLIESVPFIT